MKKTTKYAITFETDETVYLENVTKVVIEDRVLIFEDEGGLLCAFSSWISVLAREV